MRVLGRTGIFRTLSRGCAASVVPVLVLCFAVMTTTAASAQQDIGAVAAGDLLDIPLDPPAGDLAAEVDGIDVSDALRVDGGNLSLRLFTPLEPGTHELVIYSISGQDFQIVGTFTFRSFGVSEGDGSGLAVSAEHKIGVRTLNDDTTEFAESAGEFQYSTVNGGLRVGADYLATTVVEDQLTDNAVDIGEYYVELHRPGDMFDMTARIGHQSLDFDDVAVSDIARRGLGVYLATPGDRFSLGVFATQSVESLGIDNFLGLDEEDDRMFGATASLRPFSSNDFRISVTGAEARGTAEGGLTVGAGDAVSLSADGSFNDGRGRFAFGGGIANWDEDAEGGLFTEDTGEAILASLDYDILDGTEGSSLTAGIYYDRVEQGFFTLTNPSMPSGQENIILSTDYAGEALQLTTSLEQQTTNVGGLPTVEVEEYTTLDISGSYGTGEVGAADFSFGVIGITKRRVPTPLVVALPEDFDSVEAYVGVDLPGEHFSWGLTYAYLGIDDLSVLNDDLTTHSVEARAALLGDGGGSADATVIVTQTDDLFGEFVDAEAILGFTAPIGGSDWTLTGEAAWQDFGDPSLEDGALLSADLAWAFRPSAEMVFSAGYSTGSLATETTDDEEWYVGFMLRARTDVFR